MRHTHTALTALTAATIAMPLIATSAGASGSYQAPVVRADSKTVRAGGEIGVTVHNLLPGRIVKIFQEASDGISMKRGQATVNHLGTTRFTFHPTAFGTVRIVVVGADQRGKALNSAFVVSVARTTSSSPSPAPAPAPTPAPPPATCTTTSSGSCIRGGEFCPTADEGQSGTDADGRTYICEDKTASGRDHWETP